MGNTMQKVESEDSVNDCKPSDKKKETAKLLHSNKEGSVAKVVRRLSKSSGSSSSSSLHTYHDSVRQQEDEISLADSATTADYDSAFEYSNSFAATAAATTANTNVNSTSNSSNRIVFDNRNYETEATDEYYEQLGEEGYDEHHSDVESENDEYYFHSNEEEEFTIEIDGNDHQVEENTSSNSSAGSTNSNNSSCQLIDFSIDNTRITNNCDWPNNARSVGLLSSDEISLSSSSTVENYYLSDNAADKLVLDELSPVLSSSSSSQVDFLIDTVGGISNDSSSGVDKRCSIRADDNSSVAIFDNIDNIDDDNNLIELDYEEVNNRRLFSHDDSPSSNSSLAPSNYDRYIELRANDNNVEFGDVISNALNSVSTLLKSKYEIADENNVPTDYKIYLDDYFDKSKKDSIILEISELHAKSLVNCDYDKKLECQNVVTTMIFGNDIISNNNNNDDDQINNYSTIIRSDLNFLIVYFCYPALFASEIDITILNEDEHIINVRDLWYIFNDQYVYVNIIKDITFKLSSVCGKFKNDGRLLYAVAKCPSLETTIADDIDFNDKDNNLLNSTLRDVMINNVIEIVPSLAFQPAVTNGDVVNNVDRNSTTVVSLDIDNRAAEEQSIIVVENNNRIAADLDNKRIILMDTIADNFDRLDLNNSSSSSSFASDNTNKTVIIEKSEIYDNRKLDQMKENLQEMSSSQNISEAGPATAAPDLDNVHSTSIFDESSDMDYFSRFGGTGDVAENLRKQSLYVKFDPLLAAASNSTVADSKDGSPVCSNQNKYTENGLPSKGTSTPANASPVQSKMTPSPKVTSSIRYVEVDQDEISKLHSLLLKQMKKEENFQDEINRFRNENEELNRKLNNAENEIAKLNSALQAALENETKLKKELQDKIKGKQQLSLVMEEYEKTISQMVSRREEEKKDYEGQLRKIEMERDNTVQHLNNLEIAFNDIHQKYERGKAVNDSLKKNEDGLKKSIAEYEKLVKVVENKYEMLKSHAASQLEKANQELELITQSYENEQAKLKALLRKSDVQINSLQDAIDRKTKENQELTMICDELIVKLTSHSGGQA